MSAVAAAVVGDPVRPPSAACHLLHPERAGGEVHEAHAEEVEAAPDGADQQVPVARDRRSRTTERDQCVRRDRVDLEAHEQVEQVACHCHTEQRPEQQEHQRVERNTAVGVDAEPDASRVQHRPVPINRSARR
jgi:hypothetical protein